MPKEIPYHEITLENLVELRSMDAYDTLKASIARSYLDWSISRLEDVERVCEYSYSRESSEIQKVLNKTHYKESSRSNQEKKILEALKELYEDHLENNDECDRPCNACTGKQRGCKTYKARMILIKKGLIEGA